MSCRSSDRRGNWPALSLGSANAFDHRPGLLDSNRDHARSPKPGYVTCVYPRRLRPVDLCGISGFDRALKLPGL